MGSEMCIRDRPPVNEAAYRLFADTQGVRGFPNTQRQAASQRIDCLLYTSDAADERSSVDLGGRRIIKKKKKIKHSLRTVTIKTGRLAQT